MPRSHKWRSLVPGLIALGATITAALAVLLFARVGALHGSTVTLYSKTGEARGVMKGTDVWLSGQKIGQVKSVNFLPPSTDTNSHIVIVMEVLKSDVKYVRVDSRAQIRSGGTLIGAPVVYLSSTATSARPVQDGDTLIALPQGDPEGIASRVAVAARDFPEILSNVKELRAQLSSVRGTTGALMNDDQLQLDVVRTRSVQLADRALKGRGTFARVLTAGNPTARAQTALARVDTLRALLASDRTSFGRFKRDSSLMRSARSLRDEVSIALALLNEPRGTAGRVLRDSALTSQLSGAQRELGQLVADLRAHPLRYVQF
jgi:phospholipid/cholesterol/gamma-HCH transport system substrate-binding protein